MTDECSLRKAEKSIHIQTPHERSEELGLPGTAIPLGPDSKSKAVSKERHTSKTPPVETSSALGIRHTLPHHSTSCLQRGLFRHTWCTDTTAVWLWAQNSCHSWAHPQFRQHTWVEVPSANWLDCLCPRLSLRWDSRVLEEWEKQWQDLYINSDGSMQAGAMPRLRCGQTHMCLKNYAPKHMMVLEGVKQNSEAVFYSLWGAPDSPLPC